MILQFFRMRVFCNSSECGVCVSVANKLYKHTIHLVANELYEHTIHACVYIYEVLGASLLHM